MDDDNDIIESNIRYEKILQLYNNNHIYMYIYLFVLFFSLIVCWILLLHVFLKGILYFSFICNLYSFVLS